MNKEIKRTPFKCYVVEREVPARNGKTAYTYKTLEVDTEAYGVLVFPLNRFNDRNGIVLDMLTK